MHEVMEATVGASLAKEMSRPTMTAYISAAHRADGEAVGLGRLLEPAYEQAVAGCLAVVARVADVEQHVLVLMEKLVDDGEEGEAHVGVFRGRLAVGLGETELPCLTAADGLFLEEPYFVAQTLRRIEDVLLALGLHFVGGNLVNAVKLELLHTVVAIVC